MKDIDAYIQIINDYKLCKDNDYRLINHAKQLFEDYNCVPNNIKKICNVYIL